MNCDPLGSAPLNSTSKTLIEKLIGSVMEIGSGVFGYVRGVLRGTGTSADNVGSGVISKMSGSGTSGSASGSGTRVTNAASGKSGRSSGTGTTLGR